MAENPSASDSQLAALGAIGLSQYESRCFLASLNGGPSTINQIGIVAGVPRTKVYGAVRRLIERGLIEPSPDNPKILTAKSPKEFLIPLLEKEQVRIRQGLEALEELESIHRSMQFVKRNPEDRSPSRLTRLAPRVTLAKKLRDLFSRSTQRVFVLTTAPGLVRLSKMADVLFERATKEGVKVEVFAPALDEPIFATAVQSLREIPGCNVSLIRQSAMPIQLIIVDSEEAVLCELKPDDYREVGMDVGFYVKNGEMADIFEGLVRASQLFEVSAESELPA
jgi:HTH-type transcriptional regulator, sugar sensing transcriptional regulator